MWDAPPSQIEKIISSAPPSSKGSEVILRSLFTYQEDLIGEVKRCNAKVLDYFRDNIPVMYHLVDYITVEGSNPTDLDRDYKFPLIASEIFESSPHFITMQLFYAEQHIYQPIQAGTSITIPQPTIIWPLMNKLFDFLHQKQIINEVLAGYWSKVVLSLLDLRLLEMAEFMLASPGILESLINHIHNHSIVQVVEKLLIMEINKLTESSSQYLSRYVPAKLNMVRQFIHRFDTYTCEEVNNIAVIFSQIITQSYSIQDGKQLMDCLSEETNVIRFFNCLKKTETNSSHSGAAVIIQCLAQYYASNANSFIQNYPEGSEYYKIMLTEYENITFMRILVANLQEFKIILDAYSLSASLGKQRLQIIEILNQVIRIGFGSIADAVIQSNLIDSVIKLFFKHEWHNILHSIVTSIIQYICDSAVSKQSKVVTSYMNHILNDIKLTEQLMSQVGDTFFYFNKARYPNRSTTKGYLGYAIQMSDAIENYFKNSYGCPPDILRQQSTAFRTPQWIQFIENTLDSQKERGCRDLGGFNDFLSGAAPAQQNPNQGENDMAIFQEYERQQAADKMNARTSYVKQVEMQKYYKNKQRASENSDEPVRNRNRSLEMRVSMAGESKSNSTKSGVYSTQSPYLSSSLSTPQVAAPIQINTPQEQQQSFSDPIYTSNLTYEYKLDYPSSNYNNSDLDNNQYMPTSSYKKDDYYSDNPLINEIMRKYSTSSQNSEEQQPHSEDQFSDPYRIPSSQGQPSGVLDHFSNEPQKKLPDEYNYMPTNQDYSLLIVDNSQPIVNISQSIEALTIQKTDPLVIQSPAPVEEQSYSYGKSFSQQEIATPVPNQPIVSIPVNQSEGLVQQKQEEFLQTVGIQQATRQQPSEVILNNNQLKRDEDGQLIKVDRSDFKTFTFQEDPVHFEPISIEIMPEVDNTDQYVQPNPIIQPAFIGSIQDNIIRQVPAQDFNITNDIQEDKSISDDNSNNLISPKETPTNNLGEREVVLQGQITSQLIEQPVVTPSEEKFQIRQPEQSPFKYEDEQPVLIVQDSSSDSSQGDQEEQKIHNSEVTTQLLQQDNDNSQNSLNKIDEPSLTVQDQQENEPQYKPDEVKAISSPIKESQTSPQTSSPPKPNQSADDTQENQRSQALNESPIPIQQVENIEEIQPHLSNDINEQPNLEVEQVVPDESINSYNKQLHFATIEANELMAMIDSSIEYQDLQKHISEFESVFVLLNVENMQSIEDRFVRNTELRDSFIEIAQKHNFSLQSSLDVLLSNQQQEEKDMKLSFQIEFEMIERKVSSDPTIAAINVSLEQFLHGLIADRVKKLYDIHMKYALKAKLVLEKYMLEAVKLKEQLNSMTTSTAHSLASQSQKSSHHAPANLQVEPAHMPDLPLQHPSQINLIEQQSPKQQAEKSIDEIIENVGEEEKAKFELDVHLSSSPCFGAIPRSSSGDIVIPLLNEEISSPKQQQEQKQQTISNTQSADQSPHFGSNVNKIVQLVSPQKPTQQRYSINNPKPRKLSQLIASSSEESSSPATDDPYEYKASSSARDKSPIPSQSQLFQMKMNSSMTSSTSSMTSSTQNVQPSPSPQLPTSQVSQPKSLFLSVQQPRPQQQQQNSLFPQPGSGPSQIFQTSTKQRLPSQQQQQPQIYIQDIPLKQSVDLDGSSEDTGSNYSLNSSMSSIRSSELLSNSDGSQPTRHSYKKIFTSKPQHPAPPSRTQPQNLTFSQIKSTQNDSLPNPMAVPNEQIRSQGIRTFAEKQISQPYVEERQIQTSQQQPQQRVSVNSNPAIDQTQRQRRITSNELQQMFQQQPPQQQPRERVSHNSIFTTPSKQSTSRIQPTDRVRVEQQTDSQPFQNRPDIISSPSQSFKQRPQVFPVTDEQRQSTTSSQLLSVPQTSNGAGEQQRNRSYSDIMNGRQTDITLSPNQSGSNFQQLPSSSSSMSQIDSYSSNNQRQRISNLELSSDVQDIIKKYTGMDNYNLSPSANSQIGIQNQQLQQHHSHSPIPNRSPSSSSIPEIVGTQNNKSSLQQQNVQNDKQKSVINKDEEIDCNLTESCDEGNTSTSSLSSLNQSMSQAGKKIKIVFKKPTTGGHNDHIQTHQLLESQSSQNLDGSVSNMNKSRKMDEKDKEFLSMISGNKQPPKNL